MAQPIYLDLTAAGKVDVLNRLNKGSSGGGNKFALDTSQLYSRYGYLLPPTIRDLLDLSSWIMYLDRSYKRPRYERRGHRELRGWSREFHIKLGTRDPSLWASSQVKTCLEDLLDWLTEDSWDLSFGKVEQLYPEQPPLFPSDPTNDLIVLYSGGLDSLAGTVSLLEAYPARTLILTSATYDSLRKLIIRQVQELRNTFGVQRVQHGMIPFELIDSDPKKEEYTQRTRGFRFLSCGVAEAVAHNATEIAICENGVGALNLPMNLRQLGAQHTRSTHPKTLQLMAKLLEAIGYPHLRFRLPHMFNTKGELCTNLKNKRLGHLSMMTISCDSFPLHISSEVGESALHCGTCTSCLLRRVSLCTAQIWNKDEAKLYQRDVCTPLEALEQSVLEPLLMMLDQVTTIERAAYSPDPVRALLGLFPDLTLAAQVIEQDREAFGLSADQEILPALYDLFRRYAREWQDFPYQLCPV